MGRVCFPCGLTVCKAEVCVCPCPHVRSFTLTHSLWRREWATAALPVLQSPGLAQALGRHKGTAALCDGVWRVGKAGAGAEA